MKLHEFDLDLCRYVLQNVRYHLRKDRFAAFAADAVNPEVFGYLQSLRRDDEPPPMLLNAAELIDLAEVFAGGPFEFDRPWEAYESLHRRSIECVTEIRATLTPHHAQEWSVASAGFADRLESGRARLHHGIEIVHQWVDEIRRLLKAIGATALIPRPEGSFPTPTCPDSSSAVSPAHPSAELSTADPTQGSVEAAPEVLSKKDAARIGSASIQPRPLRIREVAQLFRVGVDRVRGWIARGDLTAVNLAEPLHKPRFVILPDALADFQARREVTPRPKKARRPRARSQQIDYYP
jgi:hypothetical protein